MHTWVFRNGKVSRTFYSRSEVHQSSNFCPLLMNFNVHLLIWKSLSLIRLTAQPSQAQPRPHKVHTHNWGKLKVGVKSLVSVPKSQILICDVAKVDEESSLQFRFDCATCWERERRDECTPTHTKTLILNYIQNYTHRFSVENSFASSVKVTRDLRFYKWKIENRNEKYKINKSSCWRGNSLLVVGC